METSNENQPQGNRNDRVSTYVMFIFAAACTAVAVFACAVAFRAVQQTEAMASAQQASSTSIPSASEVPTSTEADVWTQEVPTTTTIPPEPVATEYLITSVDYPLMESPEITNPPLEEPDMNVVFTNGTVPDEPERLQWLCPLTFNGSTKLCLSTFLLTNVDDPYQASVMLDIRPGAGACADFQSCFAELSDSEYCTSFIDYLDHIVRELATNGYNSDGLMNLDPSLVRPSYWDVDTENLRISMQSDCSVDLTQE